MSRVATAGFHAEHFRAEILGGEASGGLPLEGFHPLLRRSFWGTPFRFRECHPLANQIGIKSNVPNFGVLAWVRPCDGRLQGPSHEGNNNNYNYY